jgi:hypothetical protein
MFGQRAHGRTADRAEPAADDRDLPFQQPGVLACGPSDYAQV